MKRTFKGLIAAAFVVGFSMPAVSQAGHHLGYVKLPAGNSCARTGHTWLTRGRVYGMTETECGRAIHKATQGVRLTGLNGIPSVSEGVGYGSKRTYRYTTIKCKNEQRRGWFIQDKYVVYDRSGRQVYAKSYGSRRKLLDYHNCAN